MGHEKKTKQRLGMNSMKRYRNDNMDTTKRRIRIERKKEILILSFISDRAMLTPLKEAFIALHVRIKLTCFSFLFFSFVLALVFLIQYFC